jgi:4a-hydroxytetrahydrobiopterin dehydratase
MSELLRSTCSACRGGEPVLTADEIARLAPEVPQWDVADVEGVTRIRRTFRFPDFRRALAFANQVGELAESEGHHPDLHVAWGRVTVETWTHKIRGLHRNDFILAAKTDRIFASLPKG